MVAVERGKLIVQVRTHDDLRELLAAGESHAWKISGEREQSITHVQVVNFEGTQMIERADRQLQCAV